MINTGPIIHGGVVLHGIKLAENSTITTLVTSQAIIPIVPVTTEIPKTIEDKKS
jgi:hypothetical protein